MKDVNYEKLIYGLRGVVALVFLVFVGGVFLYSQFTDKALSLETVQGLLAILLPYFGLDAVVSYQQINKE